MGSGGTVYWNPEGVDIHLEQVSPLTDLAHEMWHGYESMLGMIAYDQPIKRSALNRSEYRACYFENRVRAALGVGTRYFYGTITDPVEGTTKGNYRVTKWNGSPLYVPPATKFIFIFNGMPVMHNLIY